MLSLHPIVLSAGFDAISLSLLLDIFLHRASRIPYSPNFPTRLLPLIMFLSAYSHTSSSQSLNWRAPALSPWTYSVLSYSYSLAGCIQSQAFKNHLYISNFHIYLSQTPDSYIQLPTEHFYLGVVVVLSCINLARLNCISQINFPEFLFYIFLIRLGLKTDSCERFGVPMWSSSLFLIPTCFHLSAGSPC